MTYRVQVREGLRNVDSQSVLSVLIRRGEKTDQVEVQSIALDGIHVKRDRESVVAAWGITLGHNLELMLCPLILDGLGGHLNRAEDLIGQVGLQRGSEGAVVGPLHPERSGVLLLADSDTPVPFVLEADPARAVAARRDSQRCWQSL